MDRSGSGLGNATSELRMAGLLAFAFATVMLDRMVQLFLSPHLVAEFGLSSVQLGVLAGVVSLCWAISTAIFGFVSDRIGRKNVLVPAMIAFSLASVLSGLAGSYGQLLAARALLGLCEGPCWAVVMAMMTDASSPHHRGRNLGIVNCAGVLVGSAIAPLFALQIADAFGWRYAFMVAGLPGLVSALLIASMIHEPARRGDEPRARIADVVPLLAMPRLWLCFAGAACFTTFVISFSIFAPLFLTCDAGLSGVSAGVILSASGFGGFLYSLAGPAASDRLGMRPVLLGAATLCAVMPILLIALGGTAGVAPLALIAFVFTAAPAIAPLLLVLVPAGMVSPRVSASVIGFIALGAEGVGATFGPVLTGVLADRYGPAAPLLACSGAAMVIVAVAHLLVPAMRADSPGQKH